MSGWDAERAKKKGEHGAVAPRCSRCDRMSVFDPCRDCAPAAVNAKRPPDPRLVK